MTQETKLTEHVQVGLWYETDCGAYTKIERKDGNFWLANNGSHYYERGFSTVSTGHNLIRCLGADPFKVTGDTSDGYHTFNELYEHRHTLFASLAKFTDSWKSKLHSDGTMFDGWFIAGINTPKGNATYHLPVSWWDNFIATELTKAPEFDGHTANDTLERLKLLKPKAADPFKSMCECNKNKDLQEKTTMITKEVSLSSPQPSGAYPFKQVDISKTETTTLNARRCGKTQWLDDAVKNAGDDGFKVVNIPKPDYPTKFERIFTEVLGRNINLTGPYDPNAVSRDISLAIVVTQEAIKQLKEIEGA